jgi:N-acetylglutamate synthase-like GNAT family acetyltransferase
MDSPEYILRRATVDDLDGLKQLWEWARLQVLDLERRLTEFQLIASADGDLIGAIGLHIEGKQGKIHSEAFTQPENEGKFRPQLWERVQIVARNHGLVRLWTRDASPFWHQQAGFSEPTAEAFKKLPAGFGDAQGRWWTLQLREESVAALSVEREFDLFQASQKQETERLMQLGRTLKIITIAVLVFVLLVGGFFLVKIVVKNPSILSPGSR